MDLPVKQGDNRPQRDERGRLLPGSTANPQGRPKGQTLKEYARAFLASKTEEEKLEYIKSMPPEFVWRMAEGNPANAEKVDLKIQEKNASALTQKQIDELNELVFKWDEEDARRKEG